MKDNFTKPTGYFSIEVIDKNGNITDKYEHQNQIMFRSKEVMREAMLGALTDSGDNIFINKFLLGNMGHDENILNPKNFDYTRTDLFAVEEGGKVYPIKWDKDGNIVDEGYDPSLPGSAPQSSVLQINRIFDNNNFIIEFKIVIPPENANDGSGAIAYTEAGMYSNFTETQYDYGNIFAMRTFPAKVKDPSSSLNITWRIIF
jgi:hypothetical protein